MTKFPKESMMRLFLTLVIMVTYSALIAAATFPEREITIIIPSETTDGAVLGLPSLTPFLQTYLDQPVATRRITGNSTTLAVKAAENAKPDGYTLICMILPDSVLAQELFNSGTHIERFVPVFGWIDGQIDIEVAAASPFHSLKDLIKAGKSKRLKAAFSQQRSTSHLQLLALEEHTGIQRPILIPYLEGNFASHAGIKGEVDFLLGVSNTSLNFIRDGRLKSLAVMGSQRIFALGNAPTIYELGYKNFPNVPYIRGVLAPPGTPRDHVEKLQSIFRMATGDPGLLQIMKARGRQINSVSAGDMLAAINQVKKLSNRYLPLMRAAISSQ